MKHTNTGTTGKGAAPPHQAQRSPGIPARSVAGSVPMNHLPIPLQHNVPRSISVAVDSQQMFKTHWASSDHTHCCWLAIYADGAALQGKLDLFVKLGTPPTPGNWDFHGSINTYGASVVVESPTPVGIWYILVQGHATCVASLVAKRLFVH